MKKDFLSINDVSKKEILEIIKISKKFKKSKRFPKILKNKVAVLIFQKPSTRTRVSFEVAFTKLGGYVISLSSSEMQLARGESIEDTVRTLERYCDIIAARVYFHSDLEKMSKISKISIINLLSDKEHPCQILADILTIEEKIGIKKIEKIAYVGDGNNNVCRSLILACDKLEIPLNVASPKKYFPNLEIFNKDIIKFFENPIEAAKDADVIYTDVWVSMGMEGEKEERLKEFANYQINSNLTKFAKKNFIFMHCLPAKIGEEVSEDVIYSKNSVVFDQAENRLWSSMGLLYLMFKK